MDETSSQAPQTDMDPDEIAATLGLLTTIGTQHMQSQMPQEAEIAPVEAEQGPDVQSEVEDLRKQVEDLQRQIKKDPKDELKDIRKMVEDALAEPDNEQSKT